MKYELAKELKDAGLVWEERNQLSFSRAETYPTLSELIEACGEHFAFLAKNDDGTEWFATAEHLGVGSYKSKAITPLEAVARLWLKMNKK